MRLILFVAMMGCLASQALVSGDQLEALWSKLKTGSGMSVEETYDVLKRIKERGDEGISELDDMQSDMLQNHVAAIEKLRLKEAPRSTAGNNLEMALTRKSLVEKRNELYSMMFHVNMLLAITDHSTSKCDQLSISNLIGLASPLQESTNESLYLKYHLNKQIAICEPVWAKKLEHSLFNLKCRNEIVELREKLTKVGEKQNFDISDSLVDYLDKQVTNRDLVAIQHFKHIYKVSVLEVCKRVGRLEELEIYLLLAGLEEFVNRMTKRVEEWMHLAQGCVLILNNIPDAQTGKTLFYRIFTKLMKQRGLKK